eukprot:3941495-Rhodomonas_salina.1
MPSVSADAIAARTSFSAPPSNTPRESPILQPRNTPRNQCRFRCPAYCAPALAGSIAFDSAVRSITRAKSAAKSNAITACAVHFGPGTPLISQLLRTTHLGLYPLLVSKRVRFSFLRTKVARTKDPKPPFWSNETTHVRAGQWSRIATAVESNARTGKGVDLAAAARAYRDCSGRHRGRIGSGGTPSSCKRSTRNTPKSIPQCRILALSDLITWAKAGIMKTSSSEKLPYAISVPHVT